MSVVQTKVSLPYLFPAQFSQEAFFNMACLPLMRTLGNFIHVGQELLSILGRSLAEHREAELEQRQDWACSQKFIPQEFIDGSYSRIVKIMGSLGSATGYLKLSEDFGQSCHHGRSKSSSARRTWSCKKGGFSRTRWLLVYVLEHQAKSPRNTLMKDAESPSSLEGAGRSKGQGGGQGPPVTSSDLQ